MKQNKYFSINRFARLLQNDWFIHQKSYLFTLLGMSLAIYAFSYFLMYATRHFSASQYTASFVVYLIGMGIFVGSSFPALSDQLKTTNYLLAPGSIFEKFTVQVFIRLVIFIPLALFIFWATQYLAKASLVPDPAKGFDPVTQIQDFHYKGLFNNDITNLDRTVIFLSEFSFLSVLFAGSAYFKRFTLVKSLLFIGFTIGGILLSFVLFSNIFYPQETIVLHIKLVSYRITENMNNLQLAGYLLGGLSWLFFLPLAYFKLKEKEV